MQLQAPRYAWLNGDLVPWDQCVLHARTQGAFWGANYLNNRLAHQEAVRNGYTTALVLNQRGSIAEAPGACVMMLRDGKLVTPPSTSGALEGITVATVGDLARQDFGLTTVSRVPSSGV